MTTDPEKDLRGPAIIVRGTPLTGWKFVGPFPSIDTAVEWWQRTTGYALRETATIALLESPSSLRFAEHDPKGEGLREARSPAEGFHPGVFIQEEIAVRGWSVETVSMKSGLRRDVIEELVVGKQPITPFISPGLEAAFGVSRKCWRRLQAAFDTWIERLPGKEGECPIESKRIKREIGDVT